MQTNPVYYDSAAIYIDSKSGARAKIAAIDTIISALLTTMAVAATSDNITEYQLDDGQTKIRTVYRSVEAIESSVRGLERLKNYYVNQINGRKIRLVDGKNFL